MASLFLREKGKPDGKKRFANSKGKTQGRLWKPCGCLCSAVLLLVPVGSLLLVECSDCPIFCDLDDDIVDVEDSVQLRRSMFKFILISTAFLFTAKVHAIYSKKVDGYQPICRGCCPCNNRSNHWFGCTISFKQFGMRWESRSFWMRNSGIG